MCVDIKILYLGTLLNQYEYTKIPISLFCGYVIEKHVLRNKSRHGFIYLEIRRAIYGLPKAGT